MRFEIKEFGIFNSEKISLIYFFNSTTTRVYAKYEENSHCYNFAIFISVISSPSQGTHASYQQKRMERNLIYDG